MFFVAQPVWRETGFRREPVLRGFELAISQGD